MSEFGPNVYVPSTEEAMRDAHETAYAEGECLPDDPCNACRWMNAQRRN